MTEHAVTSSPGELLAAVAHLTDQELLHLGKVVFGIADELSEKPARPRVVEVVRRCGVFLAEEQDRRRGCVDHARRRGDGVVGRPPGGGADRPDPDGPFTD
jgi:hypothetical protein